MKLKIPPVRRRLIRVHTTKEPSMNIFYFSACRALVVPAVTRVATVATRQMRQPVNRVELSRPIHHWQMDRTKSRKSEAMSMYPWHTFNKSNKCQNLKQTHLNWINKFPPTTKPNHSNNKRSINQWIIINSSNKPLHNNSNNNKRHSQVKRWIWKPTMIMRTRTRSLTSILPNHLHRRAEHDVSLTVSGTLSVAAFFFAVFWICTYYSAYTHTRSDQVEALSLIEPGSWWWWCVSIWSLLQHYLPQLSMESRASPYVCP